MSLEEYVSHHAGLPSVANAMRMLDLHPSLNVSAAELAQAKDRGVDDYLTTQSFPLMPGARELLEEATNRGLKAGIVTGADGPGVVRSVRSHELQGLLSTIVTGDELDNGKPAPDGYLLAAQRLKLDPFNCVAIEDTAAGINAASAAGMACIAVPTEMSRSHDFSRASAVVDDLHDARTWIASNFEIAGI